MKIIVTIKRFISEVKVEMQKVAWPSRHELVGNTIVVIVSTALLAVFIGIVDLIISRAIGLFLQ
jgi:preprotein translocase subunit SecE